METTFLYRGVSLELHKKNKGILIPKTNSFVQGLTLDTELAVLNSGIELGITENNAAFAHQINSNKYPSSGISTTPYLERAKIYATSNNQVEGVIYKIARSKLNNYDVKEFIVKNIVHRPKVSEDDEVILVHKDHGPLPSKIIIEVISVSPVNC